MAIRKPVANRPAAQGFSLLELLVVLTLMGLLSGLVAPRLTGVLEQRTEARRLAELEQRLHALPLRAAVEQRWIELGPDPQANAVVLRLAPGWAVRADPPVEIRPDGTCTAGSLEIRGPRTTTRWPVTAPLCRVRR